MEITIMLESEPYAVLLNKSDHLTQQNFYFVAFNLLSTGAFQLLLPNTFCVIPTYYTFSFLKFGYSIAEKFHDVNIIEILML